MNTTSKLISRTVKSAILGTGALGVIAMLSGCPAPQDQDTTETPAEEAPAEPSEAPVETPQ